MVSQMWSFA